MAAKTETVTYDLDTRTEFEIRQLPPTRALKLAAKLGRLIGPSLPELLSATKGGKSLGDVDLAQIGGGLQKLLFGLTDTELDSLLPDLLACVSMTAEGKRVDLSRQLFDLRFTGFLPQSLDLLSKAVSVNFLDFFQGPSGAAK